MKKPRRLSRVQLRNKVAGLSMVEGPAAFFGLLWILSMSYMALRLVGALLTWRFDPAPLIFAIAIALAFEAVLRGLELVHRMEWNAEASRSGLTPEEARQLWSLGKDIDRWQSRGGQPPQSDHAITLYMAVDPKVRASFRARIWADIPPIDQRSLYLTSSYDHARNMARSWFANEKAVGVGFVVKLKLKARALAQATRHELGPRHVEEFWVPTSEIETLNAALLSPPKHAATVRGSAVHRGGPISELARARGPA